MTRREEGFAPPVGKTRPVTPGGVERMSRVPTAAIFPGVSPRTPVRPVPPRTAVAPAALEGLVRPETPAAVNRPVPRMGARR
jgi:hypothetical protein